MELIKLIGMWIILIHDPGSAWKDSIPLGTGFEIYQDSAGEYWYRPDPELKPPMNQPKKLEVDPKLRGEFPVGESVIGGLYADFGGEAGVTHFTVNLVGRRRVISLSHSHGGSHGVDH